MNPIKKTIKSFSFAWQGIATAISSELNMKIHFTAAILVILFGFLLQISTTEWLIILICFGMVISAEIFNTAIESIVDKVSPEIDPLAGKAKDLAAGAVLITAICSAIVGLIIFIPKIWSLLL